jgi:hypothetical protein
MTTPRALEPPCGLRRPGMSSAGIKVILIPQSGTPDHLARPSVDSRADHPDLRAWEPVHEVPLDEQIESSLLLLSSGSLGFVELFFGGVPAVVPGRRVVPGPGVACPKSWRAGCEPAALDAESFPGCPPGPLTEACVAWRASSWGRARRRRLSAA